MSAETSPESANTHEYAPTNLTVWDLVVALQDAADEVAADEEEADTLVCGALVGLRDRIGIAKGAESEEKIAA